MIKDNKVLAVIPARGGSKGILRKNIRLVGGKPLIAWTIEEGKKSKYIDRLIVSSDDEEIISVAKEYYCEVPFIRPKELAEDTTPGIDPIIHAIRELPGYDYVVLLQPTSPLRNVEDIDGTIEKCVNNQFNYCVTVNKADKSPYWMYTIEKNNKMYPILDEKTLITRRQDSPKVFALNGAVYVANIKKLTEDRSFLNKDTVPYIMPKDRSVDIDTEFDLKLVDLLLKNGIFHQ